jgi:hypothetical protein
MSGRWVGPALLSVFAACVVSQVIVRPAVGIANNGDFPKMAGPFALGPEDGDWDAHAQYSEFLYRFIRDDRYEWESDFRTAEFLSSEYFFVKLARELQRIIQPGPRFDIRWLGGVNGAFFLLAAAVWIYAIPAPWRLYVGPLLVFIWSDVAYVQYLNSFYTDTAAMIFLVLCAGAALHAVKHSLGRLWAGVTAAAAILFAASKTQHAIFGLVFIPLFIALAYWSRGWLPRAVWLAAPVGIIAGSLILMGRQTTQWVSTPLYHAVFLRILPQSGDPAGVLKEFGLPTKDVAYMGKHAYLPDSPMQNPEWVREFHSRCNAGTLMRYYLRHPVYTGRVLWEAIRGPAANIRPYANLSTDDGYKLHARTSQFTAWSNFRGFLLKHAPWHILLLAIVITAASLWLLFRSPDDRPFAAVALTLEALAALEFAGSVLGDAAETDRHLFVFHVSTEIMILLAGALVWKIYNHIRGRQPAAAAGALEPAAPSRRNSRMR